MRNGTSGAGVVAKANLGTRPNVSSSVKSMQRGRGGVFDIVARHGGGRKEGRKGRVGERERGGRVISRELPAQPARESPSVYHIDDSLANVKSLYLSS